MTGKPRVRGQVHAALNSLVGEGLLVRFRTNFDASHTSDWVPEVSLLVREGADLATVLEQWMPPCARLDPRC